MEHVERSKDQRERLEQALSDWGVCGGKSDANFVLLKHKKADELLLLLEDQGVIPRPLAAYGMPNYLRISVGSEEENNTLLSALKMALAKVNV
jgi:histidinol-phosphate aminotransferase